MSTLTGNTPGIKPIAAPEPPIANDGWWPDIDVVVMRESVRTIGDVTPKRFRDSAIEAILAINNELADWRAARQIDGYDSLGDVPANIVDGKSMLEVYYLSAVYYSTEAILTEKFINYDTTGSGDKRVEDITPRLVSARSQKHYAVTAILEHPAMGNKTHARATVDLI